MTTPDAERRGIEISARIKLYGDCFIAALFYYCAVLAAFVPAILPNTTMSEIAQVPTRLLP